MPFKSENKEIAPTDMAREFVEQASTKCRSCANFGTTSCPAFNRAVTEKNIEPKALMSAIKSDQSDKPLSPCGDQ